MIRCDRGSALVEFAVVSPLALLLTFGVLQVGGALYQYDLVDNAARIGSRFAMVHGSSCTTERVCPATVNSIASYVATKSPGIGSLTVATSWPGSEPGCTSTSAPYDGPGCNVTVTVSSEFTLLGFKIPMSSTSSMIISQ